MKVLCFLLLIFCINISAQNNMADISLSVKGGLTISGLTSYYFGSELYAINPSYYIGGGLENSPVVNFYESSFSLAAEFSYGRTSSGNLQTEFGESNVSITSMPIMLWTKLKTSGKIVPYIKIGIGAERYGISETSEST